MLFSAKLKGFFIEKNAHSVILARTSAPDGPMVVEEIRECEIEDADALATAMAELQPKRSPSGYM